MGTTGENLARIVGQVRQSSDSVSTRATQIASDNADLGQRTKEQASNLQQTAASMTQITSTVRTNADTARHASELASPASTIQADSQQVTEAGSTMDEIVQQVRQISFATQKQPQGLVQVSEAVKLSGGFF
ncbi:MAG: hypothetical protein AB7P37_21525 [Ramlibacter sp.]